MKGRKILALLLAMGMTVSAVACGGGDTKTEGEQKKDGEVSGEQSTDEGSEEAVIDMEGDPYEVAIQVVTLPGYVIEQEEAMEEAINEITVPAINCKVDIQTTWISEVGQTTSMAVASGEKIDIIHVGTVQQLPSLVGSDILYDMNEDNLLQTHGKGLLELFSEEKMNAGCVEGQQLAVPSQMFAAGAKGMYYNKSFADAHGITVPEKCTLDEITGIFEQVKATGEDIMPMYAGSGGVNQMPFMVDMTVFGTEGAYGVVYDENNPKVENLFASEPYKENMLLMQQWREAGLLQGDLTDTNPSQAYFGAGKIFAVPSEITEKAKANYAVQYKDIELGWVEMVEPKITTGSVIQYMWGISSSCERPDKVMDFLNYLYTTSEVGNILMYGLEGVNYEMAEGSDKVIVCNGTYTPNFLKGFNEPEMFIQSPNTEESLQKTLDIEANASVSPLLGYMFSDVEFQTESAAITSIINEYAPRLNTGNAGSQEATIALIDEFVSKLKEANIDGVIAANQEQIDAFMASK